MKVNQFQPYIGEEEYNSLKSCFDINWITEGPKSKDFNDRLCQIIQTNYGTFAPNGTLALYLALRAAGVGEGDEVIVPDFTFIATANAVEMVGAIPVFAEIDLSNFQFDLNSIEDFITERTVAIMPAHLYGFCVDMERLIEIANAHNLLIIEDAAQALGVEWNEIPCGSFGDISCFSFFADKTITTGEGGFVATNNKKFYDKLLYLRNQGRVDRGTFVHPEIGYNFRITDIQASIGLTQLDKFDIILDKKRNVHSLYSDYLSDVDDIKIIQPSDNITSFIPFRVIANCVNEKSHNLMEYMKQKEIEPRTLFYPLHEQPCFSNFVDSGKELKNARTAYDYGICLPSFAALTDEQIKYVCNTIRDYFGKSLL
jgi:perosamine synthetase